MNCYSWSYFLINVKFFKLINYYINCTLQFISFLNGNQMPRYYTIVNFLRKVYERVHDDRHAILSVRCRSEQGHEVLQGSRRAGLLNRQYAHAIAERIDGFLRQSFISIRFGHHTVRCEKAVGRAQLQPCRVRCHYRVKWEIDA